MGAAERAEFKRLIREMNMKPDDAGAIVDGYGTFENFQNAQAATSQNPPAPQYTPGQTFGMHAAEGASMGYLAEGLGALGTLLPRRTPYPSGAPGIVDQYRINRDMYQYPLDQSERENPKSALGGQVTGAAGAALLSPFGAEGLGGAALGGTLAGVATGVGSSDADLTKGEWANAAVDAGVGGVLGLASGLGGYGLAKLGSAAIGKGLEKLGLRAASNVPTRGIEKLARNVGEEEIENIGATQTRGTFTERSKEIMERYPGTKFRPGQMTGDPKLLELEGKVSEFGGDTAHLAERQVRQQVLESAEMLDAIVDNVAADPTKIGRKAVSDEVAFSLDDHLKSLIDARKANAGPILEQATKSGATIPLGDISAAIHKVLKQTEFNPTDLNADLGRMLSKIEGRGDDVGEKLFLEGGQYVSSTKPTRTELDIEAVQNLRSFFTSVLRSDQTILKGLDKANERRIAHEVLAAIDGALKKPTGNPEGAQLLLEGINVWRKYSEPIEEAGTDTVNRLLGLAEGDKSDTLATKLLKGSNEEIEGVFNILNKNSPDTARNLRAQMIDDLAREVGKPERGSALAERGITNFKPASALERFTKNADKFRAINAGDPKAEAAFDDLVDGMQRYATGPRSYSEGGLGVVTRAGQLAATTRFGSGVAGATVRLYETVRRALTNEKALARAMYTTEGMETFAKALEMGSSPHTVDEKAAAAMINALTRLGIIGQEQVLDLTPKTKDATEKSLTGAGKY